MIKFGGRGGLLLTVTQKIKWFNLTTQSKSQVTTEEGESDAGQDSALLNNEFLDVSY